MRAGRLLDGFLTTQLQYVAAKPGVADVLADGPRTGAEVAEAVGADPELLARVLRGWRWRTCWRNRTGGGSRSPRSGRAFGRTCPGRCEARPLSGGALLPGGGRDAGGRAARGTAFEQVYGDRFFDYLARHPEQEATFQASMSGRAEQEAGDVVAAYDFGGLGRLVDVGGGYGILLGAVLRATPELQAVLLSRVLHDGSTTTPAACWPPAGRRWPRRAGC